MLVTGGLGFIGAHVVDRLLAAGRAVRVLDWLHPLAHGAHPGPRNPAAEYVIGDVRDAELVGRCLDDVVAVSHQAAMVGLGVDFADVAGYVSHNDLGTAVLLAELDRAGFRGRLVLAGSCVVYGESPGRCPEHGLMALPPRPAERLARGQFEQHCPHCGRPVEPEAVAEDAAPDPRNVYAATKLHQEQLCFCFARERGASVASLRYHNVYGPGMPRDTPYAGVAAVFRSALEAGRPPVVFEDGAQRRDFIHVHDVARAAVMALDADAPSGVFNVATGRPHTVGQMASALADAFGGGIVPRVEPRYRLGDARHLFCSAERAEQELGFRAEIGFADGMREFADAPLRAPATGDRPHQGQRPGAAQDDGEAPQVVVG